MRQFGYSIFQKISFLGFLIILLLSACGENSFYDHNIDVADPWESDNIIDFEVPVHDTINPFNFYINIRNTTDYKYSNVYLFIRTDFPNGQYAIDTAEIFLADVQGNWLGKGLGKYKDTQILFRKRGRFPFTGVYHISFQQAMRENALLGIKSVGIRIEKTK